jgi:hypothetical protein
LNVKPKCHYCRTEIKKVENTNIKCVSCKKNFFNRGGYENVVVAMNETLDNLMSNYDNGSGSVSDSILRQIESIKDALAKHEFICPTCVFTPEDSKETHNVEIVELMDQNPELQELLPIKYASIHGNFPIYTLIEKCVFNEKMKDPNDITPFSMKNGTVKCLKEKSE